MLQGHALTIQLCRTQYFLRSQLSIVWWLRNSPSFTNMKSEDSYSVSSRPALSPVRRQFIPVYNTIFIFRHVRKIAKNEYYLRHLCPAFSLSARLSVWSNSTPTGRVFMKFDISVPLENLLRKL
jgi:hypothetical protein